MKVVNNLSSYKADNLYINSGTISQQQDIKNMISQMKFGHNVLLDYDNWTFHIQWFMLPRSIELLYEWEQQKNDTTVNILNSANIANKKYDADQLDYYMKYGQTKSEYHHIKDEYRIVLFETGVTANYAFESMNMKTVFSNSDLSNFSHMTSMSLSFKEINGCTFRDKWDAVSRAIGWTENQLSMPTYIELSFKGWDKSTGKPVSIGSPFLYKVCVTGCDAECNQGGTRYSFKFTPYLQGGMTKDNFVAENLGTVGQNISGNTFKQIIADLEDKMNKKFFEIGNNLILQNLYDSTDMETHGKRYVFVIDSALADLTISPTSTYYNQNLETIERVSSPNATIQSLIQSIWRDVNDDKGNDTTLRIYSKQVLIGNRPDDDGGLERIYYFIIPVREPFLSNYISKHTNLPTSGTKIYDRFGDYVNYLYTSNLIPRHYEYMYSGKDNSVLSFNFKINNMWFLNSPYESEMVTRSNEIDIPKDSLPEEIFKELGKLATMAEVAARIVNEANQMFEAIYGKGKVNNSIKYMDDVEKQLSAADIFKYRNFKSIPKRNDNTTVVEETTQVDNPISSIRKTALSELHSAGRLTAIDLELIGDPFWLGDETFNNSLMNIKTCVSNNHHIIFTVNTPPEQGSNGEIDVRTKRSVTGFYIVTQMEHNFSNNGKFTQKMKAVIDPMLATRSDYEDIGYKTSSVGELINRATNLLPNNITNKEKKNQEEVVKSNQQSAKKNAEYASDVLNKINNGTFGNGLTQQTSISDAPTMTKINYNSTQTFTPIVR